MRSSWSCASMICWFLVEALRSWNESFRSCPEVEITDCDEARYFLGIDEAFKAGLVYSCRLYGTLSTRSTDSHWTALKRITRYLKGTTAMGLTFKKSESTKPLFGYVAADWATDVEDQKTVTGYLFKVYESTLSWSNCIRIIIWSNLVCRTPKRHELKIKTTVSCYTNTIEAVLDSLKTLNQSKVKYHRKLIFLRSN